VKQWMQGAAPKTKLCASVGGLGYPVGFDGGRGEVTQRLPFDAKVTVQSKGGLPKRCSSVCGFSIALF
jgi:hypothetical protein